MSEALRVLVLGGGPDREREVSLRSAAAVAAALRRAGHEVIEADVTPDDHAALDERCDVAFPVLHGRWGEGGTLQRLMEARRLKYVGSKAHAAALAMDKCASKRAAEQHGVATPEYQQLGPLTPLTMAPPLVIKPLTEGSSFGVDICRSLEEVQAARARLHTHFAFGMAERLIEGRELTIGIVGDQVLPAIQIVPGAAFYDFQAKYDRNDTQYLFEIDLPGEVMAQMGRDALAVHRAIGCRHLSRVDFMVDAQHRAWFLEINTMPGFTDHSLLPKAARQAGMEMDELCDRLIRLALQE